MKNILKLVGLAVVLAGAALAATAPDAPEINPASVGTPLALVGGAVLIIRSRIRR
jgi:hypothetical protein